MRLISHYINQSWGISFGEIHCNPLFTKYLWLKFMGQKQPNLLTFWKKKLEGLKGVSKAGIVRTSLGTAELNWNQFGCEKQKIYGAMMTWQSSVKCKIIGLFVWINIYIKYFCSCKTFSFYCRVKGSTVNKNNSTLWTAVLFFPTL